MAALPRHGYRTMVPLFHLNPPFTATRLVSIWTPVYAFRLAPHITYVS